MKTPLHKCRIIANDRQLTLARLCDVHVSTVSRLERGLTSGAKFNTCKILVERYSLYGFSMDHLVRPDNYPDFTPNNIGESE